MRMNKKGAELAIGTIVIIVLALIVLVVIALGFTSGWKNLWSRVNLFGGGSTLASVGQACQIACSSQDQTSFCKQGRSVNELTADQVGKLGALKSGEAVLIPAANLDAAKGTAKAVTCHNLLQASLISDCGDITCG